MALASLDLQAVYLGDRLGLYRALAEGGPATAPELAERAGIHPRYAREWLEHQAVGSVLDVDDVTATPDAAAIPSRSGHAAVLIDPERPWLVAPLSRFVVGTARPCPACSTPTGPARASTGRTTAPTSSRPRRRSTDRSSTTSSATGSRACRTSPSGSRDGTGRVADVACGTGWSSISIARRLPRGRGRRHRHRRGLDRARAHAAEAGVDGRVSFLFADAADGEGEGRTTS